jgi:hypothetical protein
MRRYIFDLALLLSATTLLHTQTLVPAGDSIASAGSSVPIVMKFSSTVQTLDGKAASGPRGLTFRFYRDQTGGAPLWIETQSVVLDARGAFTVLLGATLAQGIPSETFASGEPRWIGITPEDGEERPRMLLTSVPYAFKSVEADMFGGKRPEEFVSVQQLDLALKNALSKLTVPIPILPSSPATNSIGPPPQTVSASTIPSLNAELLHGFTDSAFAKLKEANIFFGMQRFPGGVDLPATTLEPNGIRVFDSAPLDFESAVNAPQSAAFSSQRFRWIAQPTLAAAPSPVARLSLLFGPNGSVPLSTGLSINSDGTINFAPGQQLPGAAVIAALSAGQSDAAAGGVANVPIVETRLYAFNQTPPKAKAIQVGTNTVTLTPCPRGINGTDFWHYLYLSGTGTSEVVLITGGTCKSGAPSGTIEFAASYAHPPGYSIGTATDGVQEAIIAAVMPNGQPSRQVMIDPGPHLFRARLSIRASTITVVASGATINCAMNDTCIMLGDPSNATAFGTIVLSGLRLAPGIVGGTLPAVEDNAQGSEIDNLATASSPIPGSSFGSLVQIDNDQATTVSYLDTHLSAWSRCDTTFCSTAIVGIGPYSQNAGVIWVRNSNLALGCSANGIDNNDGNTLNVTDSIVEAYPQFGVRARTVYTPATVTLNNVYEEVGNCTNPLGTGIAGLIAGGGKASANGGEPVGKLPRFADPGPIQYYYYIVVHSSTMGVSPAYLAGYANTSGMGTINVLWNKVGTAGVITYDVLRYVGDGTAAPYGSGPFAIATGIPQTACSDKVCSVVDNAEVSPSSYTMSDITNYWPSLWLWPGSVILTTPSDYQNKGGGEPTKYFTDTLSGNSAAGIVNSAGASQPSVFAQQCDAQSNWSSIWAQCVAGNAYSNDNPSVTGTVLQLSSNGGAPGGLKGRLIFEIPPLSSVGATHAITLADSNPDKTFATRGNRPTWDPLDTFIGFDPPFKSDPATMQLAFGAPISISNYIANVGDNLHWGERLTATAKMFRVPVQMTQIQTGTSDNTDAAGTITISGETSGSYAFTGNYASPPSCGLTPIGDPTPTGVFWETITSTTLTANVKIAGSISFSYQCWGHQTK